MFLKNENYDELRNEKVLSKPIDIRSVGSYFIQLVKGFAGITTPLLYIFLFVQNPDVFSGELVLSIMLVVEPFFLVGSFFFSLWIYLKLLPKVRERLLRKLNYPEISIRIES